MVQYTVTGYPKELEGSVPGAGHSVEMIRKLAAQFGPRCVVWRYDPVLFSSLTPPAFHLKNFKALCHDLKGAVDEVVVSFTQAYRKTRRNLDKLGEGFAWEDPAPEGKKEFLAELVPLAAKAGMKVSLCAQRDLGVPGSRDASCVDAARLSQIAGKPVGAKGKGHRPDCGCAPSKDIGSYDTCPFGCVYCYATQSRKAARARMEKHDPDLEFLK
jgi:sulfatase maturation enzyme AslB (radical SAM superfamily)